MSYQVLARKWRPATFHEMQGQQHVLQALVNALDSDRLHHAYLFTGTRGVGKTSVARILAKCLNCEKGVSSTPCGQCGACVAISENRFVDLIEVDAASRTKVEDTRELLENVQYAPTAARFKIYLIDEVHMLSTHSFNALLKTLEEPPPHVKFLFATTDPQRLPATILSRCLQFSLQKLAPELIVGHLQNVLNSEQVAAEEAGLWAIARAAEGSMRDALSLTDQAIAYGGGAIDAAGVQSMLGVTDQRSVCEVLDAVRLRDSARALQTIEQIARAGHDMQGFLDAVLSALHAVAVLQSVPDYQADAWDQVEELRKLAEQLPAEDIQLYYQFAQQARRDLPFAPEPRMAIEMALLRMLTFLPEEQAVAAQDSEGEKKKPLAPVPESAKPATIEGAPASASADFPAAKVATVAAEIPSAQSAAAVANSSTDDWLGLFARLPLSGMARNIAANCELLAVEANCWRFRLDEHNCKIFQPAHVQQIESALGDLLGEAVTVQLDSGVVERETPYLYQQRRRRERQQQAVDSIMADPNVNLLLATFGGEVDPQSIAPRDNTVGPKE